MHAENPPGARQLPGQRNYGQPFTKLLLLQLTGSSPNSSSAEPFATMPIFWDHRVVAGLTGNKAIEDAAIKWVMDLERAAGRQPCDTRCAGAPADIESPPRLIEVKSFGTSNRGYDLWLEVSQVEEAKTNPDFYVYVVENIRQGDPISSPCECSAATISGDCWSEPRNSVTTPVPWPVADYDASPIGLDG